MQPVILTNAFRRPRGTRLSSGVTVSEDTNVYACVEEMIDVIRGPMQASPLLLPTSFDPEAVSALLNQVDGIILPGAVSNIHPQNYGQTPPPDKKQTFDPAHDEADLFLIRQARAKNIPFFGICRAMQAMNVAFGGSLKFIGSGGPIDHGCSNPCDGHLDEPRYMHAAKIESGSLLAQLFGADSLSVNSMHEQTIGQLGEGLRIEARADDGIIEAIAAEGAAAFFLGVQWHPEAMPDNSVSEVLFRAFAENVAARFEKRMRLA